MTNDKQQPAAQAPVELTDDSLEQVQGGTQNNLKQLGLATFNTAPGNNAGGINILLGDGSVRIARPGS